MKRELDLKPLRAKLDRAGSFHGGEVAALIAEVRKLRNRPRVPARLVRMARDWESRRVTWITWFRRYGLPEENHAGPVFARVILAESKKGRGK